METPKMPRSFRHGLMKHGSSGVFNLPGPICRQLTKILLTPRQLSPNLHLRAIMNLFVSRGRANSQLRPCGAALPEAH
ncbi:MAG TPA: hypothetical protein PK250_17430, partial [Syntrophobacter fumaroxidans]|nr:hypothetical protein [Syntrophobacter fumaroxidans]